MSPVLRREISFAMLTMGLYAVDLLAVLMTILTSVDYEPTQGAEAST
jgi:hypothetical protein